MKTINIRTLTLALIISGGAVIAKDDTTATLKENFSKIPVVEVPAKAADIIAQAKATERDTLAANVVKIALQKSPTIAPAIVGAISHKTPDAAPVVAATAATIQPKQVKLIARAAASAAPAKAGEIVKAVCKALPGSYRVVALAVAEAAPKSAKEILAGLSEALPSLKGPLEQAMAGYTGNLSVPAVLDRVSATPTATTETAVASIPVRTPVRGPAVSPPYIPLSGTPGNVPPGGGDVPPGGRDYAAP